MRNLGESIIEMKDRLLATRQLFMAGHQFKEFIKELP